MHKITVHTTVCLTPTKEIVVVIVDKHGDILIFLSSDIGEKRLCLN